LKVSTQEPINVSHKVDSDKTLEELFESAFNFGVFREIDKVVDVDSKGERGGRDVRGGIVGARDTTCEQAWVRGVGFEADAVEYRRDFVVPVAGTSAEAIQYLLEEPVFIFTGIRTANGRFHDCDLGVGEDSLTKGILAVALLEGAVLFNREADHQLHGVGMQDGGILVGFGPNTILMVAKDHDLRLSTKRVQHFILLNGEHTHGRNGVGNTFCAKSAVLGEVNLDVGVLGFNAGFLLTKAFHPCVAIGVGWVKSSEERSGAFAFEVNGANLRCQRGEVMG
jgi:hypothetical protein